ncbi:MAG: desulfoferrodoxin [Treponema sp.]|jgi:superoxide reductase|nr:desulfoferrodoxin [Treponema sp.]
MAKQFAVYRCEKCGNILEVLVAGAGEPGCCGVPMTLLAGNSSGEAEEKHGPVIEKIAGGYSVKIGSVPHPMEERHYIQWIELFAGGVSFLRFLKPGDKPAAVFTVNASRVSAREYCNLHGLWDSNSKYQ